MDLEKENISTDDAGKEAEQPKASKETAKKKNGKSSGKSTFMKELLSGSMVSEKIILKNLGYISMCTFLAAVYIGNRFHAEKITREMNKVEREVKDLKAESLATSADLMYVSKQSVVYSMIREKGLNLEELKTPSYKLIVSKK